MKKQILITLFSLLYFYSWAQSFIADKPFHFNHYKLTSESPISAARLNKEITQEDRITLSKDGHLEANGKRIRIFGTNLSEFPQKKDAEFMAKSLANRGYNCVRFHHVDSSWTNTFLRKNSQNKWVINEEKLSDFDYFFYQLKKHGIYTNINLLTGRELTSYDGLNEEINNVKDWKHRHCLGFWNEEARDLQKNYAKELLSHTNPYTNTNYLNDPAVAIIEVNNENGLLMGYLTNWLEDYKGQLWQDLENHWNQWLEEKGYTFENLQELYNYQATTNNTLIDSNSIWRLEAHDGAKANVEKTNNTHKISISENGSQSWHVQYACPNLNISEDKLYTIKFKAKASSNTEIKVSINQAHEPWSFGGWEKTLKLTNKFQDFEFTTTGLLTDTNLRLIFTSMGFLKGKTITIKDITLTDGGNITNVTEGKLSSPNKKTIKLPVYEEYQSLPKEYKNIILNFLYDVEEDYWTSMCNYLRKDLNSQALLMGTALGCTTHHLMDCFDIIDSHAYWNHPIFPNIAWNQSDYYVDNKDLTREINSNTLLNLAKYRVYGKPFSVSEYDHPYPNQYSSQMYPMLASFASFQDWDLIFTFCDSLPIGNGQNGKINSFFDQGNNPAKSCAAPFAARIFRNFLVKPAKTAVYEPLSKEKERANLYKNHGWNIGNTQNFGIDPAAALVYRLGISFENPPENAIQCTQIQNEINLIKKNVTNPNLGIFSETNEIYWNVKEGAYIVRTDLLTISITNDSNKYKKILDNWENSSTYPQILPITDSSDFGSFISIREDEKFLIFTCSWVGNQNENLNKYNSNTKLKNNVIIRDQIPLKTRSNFGNGPVVALGMDGSINFTDNSKHTLYPVGLDGYPILNQKEKGKEFHLTNNKSLWYIIE